MVDIMYLDKFPQLFVFIAGVLLFWHREQLQLSIMAAQNNVNRNQADENNESTDLKIAASKITIDAMQKAVTIYARCDHIYNAIILQSGSGCRCVFQKQSS